MTEEEKNAGGVATEDQSPYQVLLEHFHRCLLSEEENSRRHAETTRMVVAALVAFLAVGLFRFGLSMLDDSFATHSEWVSLLVRVMLILGLGCLFWSFSYLTGQRSDRRKHRLEDIMRKYDISSASSFLFLSEDDFEGLEEPNTGTVEYVRSRAAYRLQKSAMDLSRRNRLRDAAILLSQRWFGRGILFIVLGVVLYIAAGWSAVSVEDQPGRTSDEIVGIVDSLPKSEGRNPSDETDTPESGEAEDVGSPTKDGARDKVGAGAENP